MLQNLRLCVDYTSPLWLMKCGHRERLYSKHRSCKGHLWLGNKTPRTRWYRVDLPVILLASSVAWLRSGFLRAGWEGVCLGACERHYLCLSVWMPISWPCECDRCQVLLTCSVSAERSCCICVCVCMRALKREGCLSVYVCCLTYSFLISTIYEKLIVSALLCVYVTVRQRLCYHVFTFVGLWGRFGRRKPRRAASTERPMRCLSGGCAELQADAKDCSGRCVF